MEYITSLMPDLLSTAVNFNFVLPEKYTFSPTKNLSPKLPEHNIDDKMFVLLELVNKF